MLGAHAVGVPVVQAPAIRHSTNLIEGTVLQVEGPFQVPARREPARWAAGCLFVLALFPVLIAGAVVWAILSIPLALLGLRRGGGRSFFGELVFHQILGAALRPRDNVAAYSFVVDTPAGRQLARQEGEFVDGRVIQGHRVRLEGPRRGGVLVVERGWNESLGVSLSPRARPWPAIAWFLLLILFAEALALIHVVDLATPPGGW